MLSWGAMLSTFQNVTAACTLHQGNEAIDCVLLCNAVLNTHLPIYLSSKVMIKSKCIHEIQEKECST